MGACIPVPTLLQSVLPTGTSRLGVQTTLGGGAAAWRTAIGMSRSCCAGTAKVRAVTYVRFLPQWSRARCVFADDFSQEFPGTKCTANAKCNAYMYYPIFLLALSLLVVIYCLIAATEDATGRLQVCTLILSRPERTSG